MPKPIPREVKKPIQYSHCIVSFLDLLGFKEFVEKEKNPDKISAVLNLVERATEVDPKYKKDLGIECMCFSDSVIRCAKMDSEALTAPDLLAELLALMHIQGELINQGIIVRGGVTHGPVYIDERRVFGPAYQRAYELESKWANYPRIMVDDAIIKDFAGYEEGKGDPKFAQADEDLMGLVRQDECRGWFLDYLRALSDEFEWEEQYAAFLCDHRDLIAAKLKAHAANTTVQLKYAWLAEYHNAWVQKLGKKFLKEVGTKREKLLVP